ncbi:MAG: hypothetical protein Q7S98_03130, partial [Deltaproteobacteria bacterium]|nr:hypothetical protein [Deltaproteobacteria bacterium]
PPPAKKVYPPPPPPVPEPTPDELFAAVRRLHTKEAIDQKKKRSDESLDVVKLEFEGAALKLEELLAVTPPDDSKIVEEATDLVCLLYLDLVRIYQAYKVPNYEKAVEMFRKHLKRKPEEGDIRYLLASTLETNRENNEALREYRAFLNWLKHPKTRGEESPHEEPANRAVERLKPKR